MAVLAGTTTRLRSWTASRWLARAGAALFVVSIPLALIGTNVRYLFGEQRLYTFAINRYDVAAVTGIPEEELLRATRELRAYLAGPDEYLRIQVTDSSGQTGPLFTPREVLHMRDVRALVQGIYRVQEVTILIILGYVALRVARDRRRGPRAVARLTWLSMLGFNLFGLAFGLTALLGFDRLFTRFHTLSFSNDFWQLDPRRDRLVQMFPFEFWQVATGLLVVLTLTEAALLAILSRWYLARSGRPEAQIDEGGVQTAEAPGRGAGAV
jgi:integral membrane protein (TIGR01906 family)